MFKAKKLYHLNLTINVFQLAQYFLIFWTVQTKKIKITDINCCANGPFNPVYKATYLLLTRIMSFCWWQFLIFNWDMVNYISRHNIWSNTSTESASFGVIHVNNFKSQLIFRIFTRLKNVKIRWISCKCIMNNL